MTVIDTPAPTLPRASALDTARTLTDVLLPLVGRGLIVRRPSVVRVAEWLDADRRGVRRLRRLRERYGSGPVLLRLPGRTIAMVLSPADANRVLEETPQPFSPATREKRAALSHFQPHGVLISSPAERAPRRRFNEAVLGHDQPVHSEGDALAAKAAAEAEALQAEVQRTGRLTWRDFDAAWWRVVRRVTLGDAARDDEALKDALDRLRRRANWAWFAPKHRRLREGFDRRLAGYLDRAEPGTLAAAIARYPGAGALAPHDQVSHWLFAFDAAGIAAFRTLALLATHDEQARQARAEVDGLDLTRAHSLDYLRACVLDTLRLWPTTPAVLREATTDTEWDNGTLPAGASAVIVASLFHRDAEALPRADRFTPELWLDGGAPAGWPLLPFSDGPGLCPGRHIVLLTTSTVLGVLLRHLELRLDPPGVLDPAASLPSALDHYRLRLIPLRTPARAVRTAVP